MLEWKFWLPDASCRVSVLLVCRVRDGCQELRIPSFAAHVLWRAGVLTRCALGALPLRRDATRSSSPMRCSQRSPTSYVLNGR